MTGQTRAAISLITEGNGASQSKEKDMFVLCANNGSNFYTGRAGDGWVSNDKKEAFVYNTVTEANRKASMFNKNTILHGMTFTVTEK